MKKYCRRWSITNVLHFNVRKNIAKAEQYYENKGSIIPTAVDFVNIHVATRPVIIPRKSERPACPVECQGLGAVRFVRVINGEQDFLLGLFRIEEQNRMIDGELWKSNHVDDRRTVLF